MDSIVLAAISPIMTAVMVLWVLVSILLILIILLQKGRGGGIGAAFGGAGAGSLLGTKTGDVLTWITIALVGLFLFLGVLLVKFYREEPGAALDTPAQTPTTDIQPAGDTEPDTASPGAGATDETDSTPTEPPPVGDPMDDGGQ